MTEASFLSCNPRAGTITVTLLDEPDGGAQHAAATLEEAITAELAPMVGRPVMRATLHVMASAFWRIIQLADRDAAIAAYLTPQKREELKQTIDDLITAAEAAPC